MAIEGILFTVSHVINYRLLAVTPSGRKLKTSGLFLQTK
jgi:hypothetical protein